ncbi:MAG: TonB-dependent receptor [Paludibaculum sp.]
MPGSIAFPDPDAPTDASLSDSKVSWDLSGTYSVTDAVNLYARIATGFRGASVQPASAFGNMSVAAPETNTSYEVGVKANLFDNRAKIYFNLFRYEVKDQQLTAVGGASNAVRLLNADKTEGQGAELDLQAYLTPHFLVTLGASYNDAEIKDPNIAVGTCFACTVTDPIVGGFAVIDGNPLPQAPEVDRQHVVALRHAGRQRRSVRVHGLVVSQRSELLPVRVRPVHRQAADAGRPARRLQLEQRQIRSRAVRPQHHG